MKAVISIRAYMRKHQTATVAQVCAAIHRQHKTASRIMRQMVDLGELELAGLEGRAAIYRALNLAEDNARIPMEVAARAARAVEEPEKHTAIPGARYVPERHPQHIKRRMEWIRPAGAAC